MSERNGGRAVSNIILQDEKGKIIKRYSQVKGLKQELPIGRYRIIIESNQGTMVRDVTIKPNLALKEIVRLKAALRKGFLSVILEPTKRQVQRNLLPRFDIQVINKQGKTIFNQRKVERFSSELNEGSYAVILSRNGINQTSNVIVKGSKQAVTRFYARDFSPRRGRTIENTQGYFGELISGVTNVKTGQRLSANFWVVDQSNRLIAESKNTGFAQFRLPPQQYTIHVQIGNLKSSRVVNVRQQEQTNAEFTVEPTQPASTGKPKLSIEKKIQREFFRIIDKL